MNEQRSSGNNNEDSNRLHSSRGFAHLLRLCQPPIAHSSGAPGAEEDVLAVWREFNRTVERPNNASASHEATTVTSAVVAGEAVDNGANTGTVTPRVQSALGFGYLLDRELPIPTNATEQQRQEIERQRGERVDAWMSEVNPVIARMMQKDSEIKSRIKFSSGLERLKPFSQQSQFAKHDVSPDERIKTVAALDEIILGRRPGPVTPDQALQLRMSSIHAQLRYHETEERKAFRRRDLRNVAGVAGASALTATTIIPGLITLGVASYGMRGDRRNYYRSEARPEYRAAFNSMMDLMASPQLSVEQKRSIARILLNQHIRTDNTIIELDRNMLLRFMNQQGPQWLQSHRSTIPRPPMGTPEQEIAWQDRIIAFAETGYRSDPANVPPPELAPAASANSRRRAHVEKINAISTYAVLDKKMSLSDAEKINFKNGVTPCVISHTELSLDDPDQLVVAVDKQGGEQSFYNFHELVKWVNEKQTHPETRHPLNASNIKKHVWKVVQNEDLTQTQADAKQGRGSE